jgi:hypothetical protein
LIASVYLSVQIKYMRRYIHKRQKQRMIEEGSMNEE